MATKVTIVTASTSQPSAASPAVTAVPGQTKILIHNKDASISVNYAERASAFGSSYSADEGFLLAAGAALEIESPDSIYLRAASGSPKVQIIQATR